MVEKWLVHLGGVGWRRVRDRAARLASETAEAEAVARGIRHRPTVGSLGGVFSCVPVHACPCALG